MEIKKPSIMRRAEGNYIPVETGGNLQQKNPRMNIQGFKLIYIKQFILQLLRSPILLPFYYPD